MSESEIIHKTVAAWVEAGEDLSSIQKRLNEEFKRSMTFMEVRFLVDDLGLELVDKKAEAAKKEAEAEQSLKEKRTEVQEDDVTEPELVDEGGAVGRVSVDVDAVVRPGAVISGSVTFSDGEKMGWQLDQMGQLGLLPGANPEYRPNPGDIETFQMQLQKVLSEQGAM